MDEDIKCYHEKLQKYFPMKDDNTGKLHLFIVQLPFYFGCMSLVISSLSLFVNKEDRKLFFFNITDIS